MSRINQTMQKVAPRKHQQGVVLAIFAIGMLMVLVMGGLALDVSHALLNKSRLQNSVDAAALQGAKTLDQTADVSLAEDAAVAMFTSNATAQGNGEMLVSGLGAADVIVEFSATLEPFAVNSLPAEYVRVRVENFDLDAWLLQLIGVNEKVVRASAVAGPTPTIGAVCDIAPFIVCGDTAAGGPLWGYEQGEVNVLKGGSDNGSSSGPIGPGNFQLARLGDSKGGADIRVNAAGGYDGCAIAGEDIPTEPGNTVGPVVQGINTRLGCPGGSCGPFKNETEKYPPDLVTETQTELLTADENQVIRLGDEVIHDPALDTDPSDGTDDNGEIESDRLDFNYDDYVNRVTANDYDNAPPLGRADRRNLSVVIADCSNVNTGATSLPILGFGCYFLLQEVIQQGPEAEVYGQFLQECDASGSVGPVPSEDPGPYKIVLYKDADSIDS